MNLKARALRWLAQREHSRAELRAKLLRRLRAEAGDAGFAADAAAAQVDELLDWLAAHRYLDEARFVEARVAARSARFGNRRIEGELRQHGAALDPAGAAALRASEAARAREVRARRFGAAPADAAARARQARFLAGRGFSSDAIRQALLGPADD